MSDDAFDVFQETSRTLGPQAVLDSLIQTLGTSQEYHRLFDAMLLKKKFELGLPLLQPTSFEDVPPAHLDAFKKCYVEAAREIGHLFLEAGRISDAWIYFRTIGDPAPVAEAIDALPVSSHLDEETEELLNVALYEGAHPVKGLEILLRTHGTCNTVTALDQQMPQLKPDDRRRAAAMLVREIYRDLSHSVRHEVQQHLSAVPPGESLRELVAGHDFLFAEGNYHIDVSHLNACVRFARALSVEDPELAMAIELAEYGSLLDPQFQYAGEPPFEDFYPAHVAFLKAVGGDETGLDFFRSKPQTYEEDDRDRQMSAYVLVDLLSRSGRWAEAVEVAGTHLKGLDESSGFSFAELCRRADRLDLAQEVARQKNDLVRFVGALLQPEVEAK